MVPAEAETSAQPLQQFINPVDEERAGGSVGGGGVHRRKEGAGLPGGGPSHRSGARGSIFHFFVPGQH